MFLSVLLILLFVLGTILIISSSLKENKENMTGQHALYIHSLLTYYGLSGNIAKFATAQAAHETAGFTSAIFKENNNAYGMKFVRQHFATGENRGHAKYGTVSDSVADFVGWYNRRRAGLTLPLFITSLKVYNDWLKSHNYYEDSTENYLKGVTYWYNQFFA